MIKLFQSKNIFKLNKKVTNKIIIGKILFLCPVILLDNVCLAQDFNVDSQLLRQQRALFSIVERDLKQEERASFLKYQDVLSEYPLYPYLLSLDLNNRIHSISKDEVKNFITQYGDSYLATALEQNWLKYQAKQKKWSDFIAVYKDRDNLELQCNYINAKLNVSNSTNILNTIDKIWLTGKSLPDSCNDVIRAASKHGFINQDLIWARIKLAIQEKNYDLANDLGKKLSDSTRKVTELWISVDKNPGLIETHDLSQIKHYQILDIVYQAILKLARKDVIKAISLWKFYSKKINFSSWHLQTMIRDIAINLANSNHPNALIWLDKIPPQYENEPLFNAKLKLALVKQDWHMVLNISQAAPINSKNAEKWQYWKAVALKMQGNNDKSQEILSKLAQNRNYYGFLASFRLLKPYSFQNQELQLTDAAIKKVLYMPSIKRAIEFYNVKKTNEANKELYFAISSMQEEEKQSLAFIASKLRIPNWSIMALADANNKNNLHLRFPTEYSEHVFQAAKQNNIDPAWIFAITRQESAFIPTAKSSAGALGLMQVMPGTGALVARKHNLAFGGASELFQADTNIKIGSKYLKMMLEQNSFNHVLATAAYNAGPNRVKKWLPIDKMEADAWIETIPFAETRGYVQNVLTYTIIYQLLLGKHPELKPKMQQIPTQNNWNVS